MAFSINLAIVTGNVTRDPELKYTPSGMAVCSFGVATNRSIKKGDQWEDVPTFHNIVVWAKQAEYIANTVKKGTLVTVQGRIDNRSYDGKDGTKKYISEIVADSVIPFVEKKAFSPGQDAPSPAENAPADNKQASSEEGVEDIVIPDDLPF